MNSSPYMLEPGTSSASSTAYTPGLATASAIPIDRIRALGCGLRRVWPHSISSAHRSLPYANCPLTFGMPSIRGTETPTPSRVRSPT